MEKQDFQILGNGTETQVIESATDIMNEYINNLTPRERKVMQLSSRASFCTYNDKNELVDSFEHCNMEFKTKKEFLKYIKDIEGCITEMAEKLPVTRNIEKYEDGYVVSYIILFDMINGNKLTDYVEFMVSGDFD